MMSEKVSRSYIVLKQIAERAASSKLLVALLKFEEHLQALLKSLGLI
jgi:hypothetical protein